MHASTRVLTRKRKGSTADASMASICSVTFMDPSSAPMPAPTRPLTIIPVITGPLSLRIENTITAGSSRLPAKPGIDLELPLPGPSNFQPDIGPLCRSENGGCLTGSERSRLSGIGGSGTEISKAVKHAGTEDRNYRAPSWFDRSRPMKWISFASWMLTLASISSAQSPSVNAGGIVNAASYATGGVAPFA